MHSTSLICAVLVLLLRRSPNFALTMLNVDLTFEKCKHIYVVEFTIESSKTTVTEKVKVTRKTYPQVCPAYR